MLKQIALAALAAVLVVPALSAQEKKAEKATTYDISVTADGTVYSGTMDLVVSDGHVTGEMKVTTPTEVTGKPAGTVKDGDMTLDFKYRITESGCEAGIVIDIKLPRAGAGPTTGTAKVQQCGRPEAEKITASVEMRVKEAASGK